MPNFLNDSTVNSDKAPVAHFVDFKVKGRLAAVISVLLVIGAYIVIRSFYWDCRPIWDGAVYFDGLLQANEQPFDLLKYSIDGHICQGFLLVMSLPYFLFRSNYYLFNVWLTLFGTLSIVAFYKLLRFFSGGRAGNVELALVTALFAFHPSLLASMIHFNIDIGVVTFFLWYWLLLLEERTVLAAILGALLILTKETALLLIPLPFLFCWLAQAKGTRTRWLRQHWWAVWAPYCALGCPVLFKMSRNQPLFWNLYNDSSPMITLLKAITPDKMLVNYLGLVFVLNFNWILSLLCLGLFCSLISRQCSPESAPRRSTTLSIWLLFLLSLGVALLVRPFSNVRYMMPIIALMLLGAFTLALLCVQSRFKRITASALLLVLFVASDVRTLDPVSKAFFGTFHFGKHEMLSITRRTGETGGNIGRDQLVYNLEFMKFSQLSDRVIEQIHPTTNTFILCNPVANFRVFPKLDTSSNKPTFDEKHSFTPHYTDVWPDPGDSAYQINGQRFALSELPKDVYYVTFPNAENPHQLEILKGRYLNSTNVLHDIAGYQMTVTHLWE